MIRVDHIFLTPRGIWFFCQYPENETRREAIEASTQIPEAVVVILLRIFLVVVLRTFIVVVVVVFGNPKTGPVVRFHLLFLFWFLVLGPSPASTTSLSCRKVSVDLRHMGT
jgi:membrane protein required for beta-lactamase induction